MASGILYNRPLRIACWLAFATGLAVNLIVWSLPKGAHIGDGNAFRQFQTALTTRYLVRDGFRIDYETPVLGPPWSIPMEFPLYQYTVAALIRLTGMQLEPAGRIVSMAYFWAALPALWLLLGMWGVARETRLLTLALLLSSPIYLFYGRHFMIETTALCLGVWFLWSFLQTLTTSRIGFGLLASLLGVAAGLAKITTFVVFALAAALIMIAVIRQRPREWLRLLFWSALVMLLPLTLSYGWVHYADHLKAQNPIGNFLVSSKLTEFNFASPGERFEATIWQRFFNVTRDKLVTPYTCTLVLLGFALIPSPRRWLVGACLLSYAAIFAVFTNLYSVHEYYYVANSVFVVTAIALCLEGLLTCSALPTTIRIVVVALALFSQVSGFWYAYHASFTTTPPGPPAIVPIIDRLTDPEDVIVVIGQDWNSSLLYYSDRRGIMLPNGFEQNREILQKSVDLLGKRRVGALIVTGNYRNFPLSINPQMKLLGVTLQPVAETEDFQLHLRRDRLPEMAARLAGGSYPSVKLNLQYDPTKDPVSSMVEDDLTLPEWRGRFPMTSPSPSRVLRLFPIATVEHEGTTVIGTHAPNSLYFQPPAGTHHFKAAVGMFPGAYTGVDHTDGVTIQVWEQLPSGQQHQHFWRQLMPQDNPADRGDIPIEIDLDRPFVGPLILRVEPVAKGRINFTWVYWRSVKIY